VATLSVISLLAARSTSENFSVRENELVRAQKCASREMLILRYPTEERTNKKMDEISLMKKPRGSPLMTARGGRKL